MVKFIFALLLMLVLFSSGANASEDFSHQITTIIKFHEMMSTGKTPSVKDYFELFGRDNESELELILIKKFPSLNHESRWFDNKDAKIYIDEVYSDPEHFPSQFLNCMKVLESSLFSNSEKILIEIPPTMTGEFRVFSVLIHDKKVRFEFSQEEYAIENIYLPNGKSIYNLISVCPEGEFNLQVHHEL